MIVASQKLFFFYDNLSYPKTLGAEQMRKIAETY